MRLPDSDIGVAGAFLKVKLFTCGSGGLLEFLEHRSPLRENTLSR
ncbi:hypothetical protein HMPREF0578_0698 [Mobiluncus mulieris 28-1]|nr:hypothetical protein HMPREF0578_0698 [Mobiluncus mulieris 28-1]